MLFDDSALDDSAEPLATSIALPTADVTLVEQEAASGRRPPCSAHQRHREDTRTLSPRTSVLLTKVAFVALLAGIGTGFPGP